MTVEEKAKAYDEAMKWVRELYPGLHGATKEDAEHYFPELRESEDERARKALICGLSEGLSEHNWQGFGGATIDECLAYLEKQKSLNISAALKWLRENICHYMNSEYNEFHKCVEYDGSIDKERLISDFEEVIRKSNLYSLENGSRVCEQKERKSRDYCSVRDEFDLEGNLIQKSASFSCGHENDRPAEWSKDYDEENLQTRFAFYTYKDDPSVLYLSNVFVEEASRNHGFGTKILIAAEKVAEAIGATTISLKVKQDSPANAWYRKNGYGYVSFEDGYDWLEKNLEYMKPNKQEWSEEDADIFNCCISSIEEAKENRYAYKETDGDTSYDREIAWLKSIRPQPHWKPSNEQINYLGAAVIEAQRKHNESVNGFPRYRVLKELYEQLLKL